MASWLDAYPVVEEPAVDESSDYKSRLIKKILSGAEDYTYGPGSPTPTPSDMRQRIGSRDNPLSTGDVALPLRDYGLFTPEERDRYRIADTSWFTPGRPTPRGSVERYYGADMPMAGRPSAKADTSWLNDYPVAEEPAAAKESTGDTDKYPVAESKPAEMPTTNIYGQPIEGNPIMPEVAEEPPTATAVAPAKESSEGTSWLDKYPVADQEPVPSVQDQAPLPPAPEEEYRPQGLTPAEEQEAVAKVGREHPYLKNFVEATGELVSEQIPRTPREYLAQIYPPAAAFEQAKQVSEGHLEAIPGVGTVKSIQEAEETPAFSKERFKAAERTLMDLGMLAGIAGGKARPRTAAEAVRAEPVAPLPEAITRQREAQLRAAVKGPEAPIDVELEAARAAQPGKRLGRGNRVFVGYDEVGNPKFAQGPIAESVSGTEGIRVPETVIPETEAGVKVDVTHYTPDPARQFTSDRPAYFHPAETADFSNLAGETKGKIIQGSVELRNPVKLPPEETVDLSPTRIKELRDQGYDGVIATDNSEVIAFDPKSQFSERSRQSPAEVISEAARPAPAVESTTPEAAAPTEGVSVPVMITRQMESDLLNRGFSQGEINKMTPQHANEILAQPTTGGEQYASTQPETTGVGIRGEGGEVGEGAPFRYPGEVAEVRPPEEVPGGAATPEAQAPVAPELIIPKSERGYAGLEPPPTSGLKGQEGFGPGAAAASEFPPKQTTSTKNAVIDAERKARGLEPIAEPARQSHPELWDQAEAIMDQNPEAGTTLIDRILRNEHKANAPIDEALALREKIRVQNERTMAEQRAADENLSPTERNEWSRKADEYEARLNEIDIAERKMGTEWGRMGAFRSRLAADDYTLAEMQRKGRLATGAPLDRLQRIKVAGMQRKISAAKKTVEELTEAYNKKRQANIEKRITELGELKAAGKFKRDRKPLPEKSLETLRAEGRLLGAVNEFKAWVMEQKLKALPWHLKSLNLLQQVRGIILGFDLGMFGRQGLFSWSRPHHAIRATGRAFRAMFSPDAMNELSVMQRDRIINGKSALKIRRESGLQTTDTLTHPEELVITRLLSRVPDIVVAGKRIRLSRAARALERTQVAFINSVRTDAFDAAIKRGYSPDELKQRARFINNATGRGNMKYVPNALATIMTAPRYESSRWAMLAEPIRNAGRLAIDGSRGKLNRAALANLQDVAVTAAGIYGLFKMAELSGYSVTWNPASSDFLKMRKGNDVWDVSAGIAPRLRDALRLLIAFTHPSYRSNIANVIKGSVMRTINPAIRTTTERASVAVQKYQGEKEPRLPFEGMKSDEERTGWITVAPLIVQSMNQALEDDWGAAAWAGAREFAGTGATRYPEPKNLFGDDQGGSTKSAFQKEMESARPETMQQIMKRERKKAMGFD